MTEVAAGCEPLPFADPLIGKFVLEQLGDRCQEMSIVVPTLVIYAILLVLGVVGNVCTCVVIVADRSMHNPTNFYLFSLAVSDIIILILGLPMELHGVVGHAYPYEFGPFVCKLRAFLTEFTSYASVTVICAFSVERYFAICFPLRAKMFSTLRRAGIVILFSWILSFFAALPMAGIVEVNRLPLPADYGNDTSEVSSDGIHIDNTEFCSMDFNRKDEQKRIIYTSAVFFFTIPAIVMTFMYGHIAYRLRTADRMLTRDRSEVQRMSRGRRTVIKVLVSVVVTFFAFWLPFHAQRLLSVILNEHPELGESKRVQFVVTCLFYISGTCYYSNSVCNPILYNVLSTNYRRAFCRTILGERLARKLMPRISAEATKLSVHSDNCRRPSALSVGPQTRLSLSSPAPYSVKNSMVTLKQYPPEMVSNERRKTNELIVPSITVVSESEHLLGDVNDGTSYLQVDTI